MSSTNQYDAPSGDVVDDDYKSRTGQSAIPVQGDGAAVEATEYDNGGDSEQQLEKDENDAIDRNNILDERTRGAAKKAGAYTEPGDEDEIDDLTAGGQDGTSSGRQ